MTGLFLSVAALVAITLVLLAWQVRRRHMLRWLPAYLREIRRRRLPRHDEDVHLLLCVADHYEPKMGGADRARALSRVETWLREYPRRFGGFRDSDGRPPRHTFFFPIEEYEPEYLDRLAELCRAGYGEVEVHLHHDRDSADNLRRRLAEFKELLARQHGLLARHRDTGGITYGFIHGNWALCNSRPDGRWCGANIYSSRGMSAAKPAGRPLLPAPCASGTIATGTPPRKSHSHVRTPARTHPRP
jgi:hypothetical protein